MAYPPAPGATNSSLPPRPPPSKASGFKPAFSVAPTYTPSSVAGNPYTPPAYSSAPSYGSAPASQYGGGRGYPPQGAMNYTPSYQQPVYQQGPYGAAAAPPDNSAYAAGPQIRNPFPAPSPAPQNSDYDPEMAAQIAQWQSAYVKDPKDAETAARLGAPTAYSANPTPVPAAAVPAEGDKRKTVVRQGGGQKWTDDSLLEWDPAHLRLFVGNLAGETTDESLHKAFARWKSLQKARVVRDKVTSKSKGFGFVSFSDPDDFFQAAKEMNGKYIQSHPVVVRKSTTEIKPHTVKDKRHGGKWNNKNKNKNRSGNGSGGQDGSFEPSLGPATSAGVVKPGQKTKNGLKLLG